MLNALRQVHQERSDHESPNEDANDACIGSDAMHTAGIPRSATKKVANSPDPDPSTTIGDETADLRSGILPFLSI